MADDFETLVVNTEVLKKEKEEDKEENKVKREIN